MSTRLSQSIVGLSAKNSPFDATERYSRANEDPGGGNLIVAGTFVARVSATAVARVTNLVPAVTSDLTIIGVASPQTGGLNSVDVVLKGLHIPVLRDGGASFSLGDPVYVNITDGRATNTDNSGANPQLLNAKVSGVQGGEGVLPPIDENDLIPAFWVYIDLI